jgi:hypothetical protein
MITGCNVMQSNKKNQCDEMTSDEMTASNEMKRGALENEKV